MARDKALPQSKKVQERQKQLKRAKRPTAVGHVLIICEGEKTEPNYFNWWRKQLENIRSAAKTKPTGRIDVNIFSDTIDIKGEGRSTRSLVKQAIILKNLAPIDYKQIWCVFDRDSFTPNDYNAAIEMAHAEEFHVAFSNEAFEFWYLLHFDFFDTGVSRSQYKQMLTDRLGETYQKNDSDMYEKLLKHSGADQKQAIKNAKKLYKQMGSDARNYADFNPSTTVFKLVESLNKHVCQFRCQLLPDYPLPFPCDCGE